MCDRSMDHFFNINCETTLNDIKGFAISTAFFIVCKQSCASAEKPIYGSNGFSADSSLCKAAEHSGSVTKTATGIYAAVNVSGMKKEFEGGVKNSVVGESKKYDADTIWFTISPYSSSCPMEV